MPTSTAVQTTSQQPQHLCVSKALSYLYLVKSEFVSQPQVYNDFLDTMKEFKLQSIDTLAMMMRISKLFKGHPDLIVEFNKFLPPGYKIEVQSSDSGVYTFKVPVSIPCSPSSSTSTLVPSSQSIQYSNTITDIMSTVAQMNLSNNVASNVPTVAFIPLSNSDPPQPFMNPATHEAVSQAHKQVESGNASQQIQQNQLVKYNSTIHAINYLNKIQNRLQGQPGTYNRLLEILHTYQKEQRILKEHQQMYGGNMGMTLADVYNLQMAKMLENEEDLLVEFGMPPCLTHLVD